jgi:hypothetical protein
MTITASWPIKLAFLLLLLPAAAMAQIPISSSRIADYPLDGVSLGGGWLSVAGTKTLGRCIIFQPRIDPAQDQSMTFVSVRDKDSLMQALEVSAEFQAKTAFGAGASGKAEFAKRVEIKSDFLSISVQATVRQGAQFVDAPNGSGSVRLTDEMAALARRSPEQFLSVCGDSFVASLQAGAQLSALLTFKTTSREEQETIRASVSGSYIAVSASASVSNTLKTYSERNQLEIVYHHAGGSGSPLPVTEAELLDRIRALPSDAAAAPQNWSLGLRRYDTLPNWPRNRSDWKLGEIESAARQYYRLATIYYDLFDILAERDKYYIGFGASLGSLKKLQDEIQAHMDSLSRGLHACMLEGSQNCVLEPSDMTADYEFRLQLPVRKGSFSSSTLLEGQRSTVASLRGTVAALPDTISIRIPRAGGGFPPITGFDTMAIENPGKKAKAQELVNAERALTTLEERFLPALREAVFKHWIEGAAIDRCLREPRSSLCLSQAAMDAYRGKVDKFVLAP